MTKGGLHRLNNGQMWNSFKFELFPLLYTISIVFEAETGLESTACLIVIIFIVMHEYLFLIIKPLGLNVNEI